MNTTRRKAGLPLVLGLGLGFVAGFAFARLGPDVTDLLSDAKAIVSGGELPEPVQVPVGDSPAWGPEDAPVTIVEFTDYQCPFCKRHFDRVYPWIKSEHGDRVRYVVRNLPLPSHPDARSAAEAAGCARDQDKFWEYHDVLFRNQTSLLEPDLRRYAGEVGLDVERFSECLESGTKEELVARDLEAAGQLGVASTPAFFIGGRRLVGAWPADSFRVYIQAALEDAGAGGD